MFKINILKTTFFKFLVVGGSGAIINIVAYGFLINVGFHFLLASVLSFILAVTSNYYFNSIWTFKNKANHKSKFKKYYEFFGISVANLLTNLIFLSLALWYLNKNLGIGQFFMEQFQFVVAKDVSFFNKILAQMIGIGFATVLNYLGNKFITFKDQEVQSIIKS